MFGSISSEIYMTDDDCSPLGGWPQGSLGCFRDRHHPALSECSVNSDVLPWFLMRVHFEQNKTFPWVYNFFTRPHYIYGSPIQVWWPSRIPFYWQALWEILWGLITLACVSVWAGLGRYSVKAAYLLFSSCFIGSCCLYVRAFICLTARIIVLLVHVILSTCCGAGSNKACDSDLWLVSAFGQQVCVCVHVCVWAGPVWSQI